MEKTAVRSAVAALRGKTPELRLAFHVLTPTDDWRCPLSGLAVSTTSGTGNRISSGTRPEAASVRREPSRLKFLPTEIQGPPEPRRRHWHAHSRIRFGSLIRAKIVKRCRLETGVCSYVVRKCPEFRRRKERLGLVLGRREDRKDVEERSA